MRSPASFTRLRNVSVSIWAGRATLAKHSPALALVGIWSPGMAPDGNAQGARCWRGSGGRRRSRSFSDRGRFWHIGLTGRFKYAATRTADGLVQLVAVGFSICGCGIGRIVEAGFGNGERGDTAAADGELRDIEGFQGNAHDGELQINMRVIKQTIPIPARIWNHSTSGFPLDQ